MMNEYTSKQTREHLNQIANRRILQLVPADGWKAVYRVKEDGTIFKTDLAVWALIENPDVDGTVYTDVMGMDTIEGFPFLIYVDEETEKYKFVEYEPPREKEIPPSQRK